MTFQQLLPDNPILVKHVRSRLRRQQLFPSMAATALLCAMILWIGYAASSVQNGIAFGFLVFFQAGLLFVGGASQVGTSVAGAREAGVLDFHRISPVPPAALALGFLLGGPVREYVLFLCTLPFAIAFVALGWPSPLGFLELYFGFLVLGLLYHSMALLAGLVSARSRNASGGIVALVLLLQMIQLPPLTYFTIMPVFAEAMDRGRNEHVSFFGLHVPALALCLTHQLPLLFFLWIAAVRRMRHDRAFFWSKPVAVIFHAVLALLVLGDVVGLTGQRFMTETITPATTATVALYALTGAALLLTLAVTPGAGDLANGTLRARKQGRPRAAFWSDLSSNQAALFGFCAVLLLATAAAGGAITRILAAGAGGALVVLYFGNARQALELLYRRNGTGYFVLFLFLLWFLPLLAGWAAAASHVPAAVASVLSGASPLYGIHSVANASQDPAGWAGGAVFLGSSLVLAGIFWQLRAQAERRVAEGAVRGPG